MWLREKLATTNEVLMNSSVCVNDSSGNIVSYSYCSDLAILGENDNEENHEDEERQRDHSN